MKFFLFIALALFLISCGSADFGSTGADGSILSASSVDLETVEVVSDETMELISFDPSDGDVITPTEMEDKVLDNSRDDLACEDGRKVVVCHYPNGDDSKKKTLCIGAPALNAHLKHMHSSQHEGHLDFAGRCKSDEGLDNNKSDNESSKDDGSEDSNKEIDSDYNKSDDQKKDSSSKDSNKSSKKPCSSKE